jgi:hypothetical protein
VLDVGPADHGELQKDRGGPGAGQRGDEGEHSFPTFLDCAVSN